MKPWRAYPLGGKLLNAFGTFYKGLNSGDHFSFRAPTFVSLLLFSCVARAGFDASAGGTFRAYPLSGVVEADAGYGYLIWGAEGSPLYGYIRPKIEAASAISYNSAAAVLEVFPVSFLGVRGGGESIENDKRYSDFNCTNNNCLGRFYRTFAEAELTLGYGRVFAQGRIRRERWSQKEPEAGDFVEPTSGITLKSGGDSETVYIGLIGFKYSETWSILAVTRYAESDGFESFSRLPYGVIRYTSGTLQLGAGLGEFESSLKTKDLTVLGFLKWEIAPSVALK
jgi:hypothetical protein